MDHEILLLDVCGLKCPLLFVTVKMQLKKLRKGQILKVSIDDEVGQQDVVSYLQKHQFKFSLTPLEGTPVTLSIYAKDN